MNVYADSQAFAREMLREDSRLTVALPGSIDPRLVPVVSAIFGESEILTCEVDSDHEFDYMFMVEHAERSQYDLMVDLCKRGVDLPHGILCLAGSGSRFHGQRGRQWDSPPGNIYLTAVFSPKQDIANFGPGFIILPAVSVVQTIDSVPGLEERAKTKWVNDILIDGAKVAGVLTYTQAMGSEITGVVLGIGLNVETTPNVESDSFAPKAAALIDFEADHSKCNRIKVLRTLIDRLSVNYGLLLDNNYPDLLDVYRGRSAIIGKEVELHRDEEGSASEVVAKGRVEAIGENLELYLVGHRKSISRGRLALKC